MALTAGHEREWLCVSVYLIITLQRICTAHHVGVRDATGLQDTSLRDAGREHLLGYREQDT